MYLRARNYGISYLPQEPSVFRKLTWKKHHGGTGGHPPPGMSASGR